MESIEFGPIKVIPGERDSTFPNCTSLLIEDEVRVLIDPGCGERAIEEIKGNGTVDRVINTHYHFDHIRGNHLFPDSEIYINEIEADGFGDLMVIAKMLGLVEVYGQQWAEEWVEEITAGTRGKTPYSPGGDHRWYLSTRRLTGTYGFEETLDFGRVKAEVRSGLGHSLGNCCLFFPDQRIVYTGDFDLTNFGPWYGGSDGDITAFVQSATALIDLEADHFITGHEEGILSLDDFLQRISGFLDVIDKRDKTIRDLLETGLGLEDLVSRGIFYPHDYQSDPWIHMWEKISVKHHIRRLLDLEMLNIPAEKRDALALEVEKPYFTAGWYGD